MTLEYQPKQLPDGTIVSRHGDQLGPQKPCPTCEQPTRRMQRAGNPDVVDADPRPAHTGDQASHWNPRTSIGQHAGNTCTEPAYHRHQCTTNTLEGDHLMFESFTPPAVEDGDTYPAKDHAGAVIIVKVRERKEGIVTEHTPDPGGPGVIVDLVDLGDGQIYRNVLWMGGQWVDALSPYIGKGPVVLEIEHKQGKTRKYFAPKAADDAQIKLAESYYSKKGDPFAQVFATVDTSNPLAPAADTAPPW